MSEPTPNYPAPTRNPKPTLYDLKWFVLCKDWYMTDLVPQSHVVIHQNHNGLKKAFSSCTPEKLLTLVETNRGIYEMITRFPHKFYADIDLEPVPEGFNQTEYLAMICEAFKYFLPDIEFAISGSVTETRASYHLVAQNYVIASEAQRSVCKLIAQKIHENDDDGVDWKVYTRGRQMKCINQTKPKKQNVQLPITHLDNPKAHIITTFFEGEQSQIPPIESLSIPARQQLERISQCLATDDPVLSLPNPKNIIWDELTEPEHKLTLLGLIPNNKSFSHGHTTRVMNFCVCNDIHVERFLEWLDRKSDNVADREARRNKYTNVHWDKVKNEVAKCKTPYDYKFFVSQYSMRQRLKRWYPNIEPRDAIFANFKEYMTPNNVIIRDTIDYQVLDDYKATKFVGLTQPMGSGKTNALIDYLKYKPHLSFLYVCHRVCVTDDIYTRMEEHDINVVHYRKIGRNKHHKKELLRAASDTPNVIICINSIDKLIGRDKPFDVIIIDEVESTFNSLCSVSTDRLSGKAFFANDDKRRIIDTLSTSVQRAKKIFALDAFLTRRWQNFCKMFSEGSAEEQTPIILDLPPPAQPPRSLVTIEKNETTYHQIVDSIATGHKVFVSYPYKKTMEVFVDAIGTFLKKDPRWEGTFQKGKDYEYYNADVSDKTKKELADVNEHWSKYKLIVTNTVLTAGVSYTVPDVDEVYLFAASFSKPRDLIQVSYRCRALSSRKVYICHLPSPPQEAFQNDASLIERDVYSQLMKDTIDEFRIDTKRALNVFAHKAHWNVDDPIKELGKLDSFKQVIEDCKAKIGQLDWDSVQELDDHNAAILEREHLINADAKTEERHQLRKHYFKKLFTPDVPAELLAHIWNHGRLHIINACNTALQDPESFENIIRAANDWIFFPYIDESTDPKKWKPVIPPEAKAIFKKEFFLKYEQSGKKTASLLRKVFNTKYGVEIISKHTEGKGKNVTYDTPHVEEYQELYEEAKKYLQSPTLHTGELHIDPTSM